MNANQFKVVGALIAGFVAGTVAYAQGTADGVVGKMGNLEMKTADVRRIIDAQPPQVKKQVAGAVADLDRLVRSELIRQSLLNEAKGKGVDKRPDVVLMMERARDQALLQAYMTEIAKPPAGFPSDEDIKKAYDANKTALATPPEFNLAQIFIAVPESADKATVTAAIKKANDVTGQSTGQGRGFRQARTRAIGSEGNCCEWWRAGLATGDADTS